MCPDVESLIVESQHWPQTLRPALTWSVPAGITTGYHQQYNKTGTYPVLMYGLDLRYSGHSSYLRRGWPWLARLLVTSLHILNYVYTFTITSNWNYTNNILNFMYSTLYLSFLVIIDCKVQLEYRKGTK